MSSSLSITNRGTLGGLERVADDAADAAVADEHHMIGELRDRHRLARRRLGHGLRLRFGRGGFRGRLLRRLVMGIDPVRAREQERREQDRDQRACKDEIAPGLAARHRARRQGLRG